MASGGDCVPLGTILPAVLVGTVGAVALAAAGGWLWRRQSAVASRRLIGAPKGTPANQQDLPAQLRRKYEAVQVSTGAHKCGLHASRF